MKCGAPTCTCCCRVVELGVSGAGGLGRPRTAAAGGRCPLGNGRVRVNEWRALRRPVGAGRHRRSGGGEEETRKADGWRARTRRGEAGVEQAGAPSCTVSFSPDVVVARLRGQSRVGLLRPASRVRIGDCWAVLVSGWAIGLPGVFMCFYEAYFHCDWDLLRAAARAARGPNPPLAAAMDAHRDDEEAASPLIAAPVAGGRSHAADAHVLSAAFLFVFSAYSAAQNLQTSVNTEGDLGTVSMGTVYTSLTLFSVAASPVVTRMGPKRALVVGTSGYVLFILANLVPTWYTMVPASLYLGFTASIIWVGQGTYLTSAALSHARENNLPEGPTLGSFNGEFWGMFASTQVIGNLISLALLRNGKDGGSVTGKNLLFAVFLGCMIVGIVLMCLLSKRDEKRDNTPTHSSFGAMLKYIIAPLKDQRMLLTIPLIVYSGLQQAFVWAVFTKSIVTPVLGISGVGGAMAIYGAADVVCSLVAGRLTSGLRSAAFIVSVGAILQAIVLFWLLLFYSPMDGLLGAAIPLFIGALWGVGDGVLNTQLSALLGLLFEDVKEAAFAQLKVWQSGAIAVIFFLSPSITLQAMLILMAAGLVISFGSFLFLTLVVEKSSPVIA